MPLPQLQAYHDYTLQHGLPLWRIEMQLAQIAMLLDAQRRPGQSLSLRDYLVRPMVDDEASEPSAAPEATPEQVDALCEAIAFSPRPKRRRPDNEETS
jgi:hypothetical protein